MIMMYGTLFMMAGAYTLAKNGHVRGDVIYGFFTPRAQAILDLTLYILFFISRDRRADLRRLLLRLGVLAINEHSNITAEGPPVYPFKTVIPLAGAFVLVQGIVEIIPLRHLHQQGEWPSREPDVQEVDVEKLKEMVHVKDEDIAKLDKLSCSRSATNEAAQGTLVRLFIDGGDPHPGDRAHALEPPSFTNGQFGPYDARAPSAWASCSLSHGLHAHGDGRVLRPGSPTQRGPDDREPGRLLDLFVQRTYGVMSNDVLNRDPAVPVHGLPRRAAQLIDKCFRSLHLAAARVPGALAVATIVTCAIFATATGIVGAVVTLMGLLAFPAMLKAGYNVKVAAGAVTAGGCLGI